MLIVSLTSLYLVVHVGAYMVDNNPYNHIETLDSSGKYQLEWVVDFNAKRVNFSVTCRSRGYVGFGLSSNGKMSGADVVIGGITPNGKTYFSDRHAVGNQYPELDPQQDWTLHSAWENKTHTFLFFSRAFDTCDLQDYPITEDKISLIWAYGETDNELEYHHGNRGVFHAYLLHPDYTPEIDRDPTGAPIKVLGEENSDMQVWTINRKMQIPSDDTTYWCTMHAAPKLPQKHHLVGFEARFNSEESRVHTHHLIMYKCKPPPGRDAKAMFSRYVGYRGQQCLRIVTDMEGPMPIEYCSEHYHVWAVGGKAYFLPPQVGLPLGSSPDEYYILQIHYNNPNLRNDLVVDVSLDFFYTSNLRSHDGGMFGIFHGIPGTPPSLLIPPSSINQQVYGICSSECSRDMFPKEGVYFTSAFLHSHNSGRRIRVHHFRNNVELPWISSDDNYGFNYQNMRTLREEVNVLPGDQLVIRCTFDNTWTNGTVVGGFATTQEMCLSYLFYYNKLTDHIACISEISSPADNLENFLGVRNVSWDNSQLEYTVNPPHKLAGLKISQVSDQHVTWDLNRRREFQDFQLNHPHISICPNFSNWHESPQIASYPAGFPTNIKPYRPQKMCPMSRQHYNNG